MEYYVVIEEIIYITYLFIYFFKKKVTKQVTGFFTSLSFLIQRNTTMTCY